MLLQEQVIQEIHEIPPEKLMDVYKLIHQFRLSLSLSQPKKYKTIDEVFGKLHKPERKIVSIEEMNVAIQTRMRNKFK
jgi:hypothetical protein